MPTLDELKSKIAGGKSMQDEDERFSGKSDAPNTKLPQDALGISRRVGPGYREEPSTFKEAFAAARAAGDKTFEFGGKKYNTDMKKATKSSAPRNDSESIAERTNPMGDVYKKGGKVKKMASGGKTSSASSRGDGCAMRGKTRGKMV